MAAGRNMSGAMEFCLWLEGSLGIFFVATLSATGITVIMMLMMEKPRKAMEAA